LASIHHENFLIKKWISKIELKQTAQSGVIPVCILLENLNIK
jgi:hypothetical protein